MSLFRTEKRLMSAFRISYFPHSMLYFIRNSRSFAKATLCTNNAPLFLNNPRLFSDKAGFLKTPKSLL